MVIDAGDLERIVRVGHKDARHPCAVAEVGVVDVSIRLRIGFVPMVGTDRAPEVCARTAGRRSSESRGPEYTGRGYRSQAWNRRFLKNAPAGAGSRPFRKPGTGHAARTRQAVQRQKTVATAADRAWRESQEERS